MVGDQWEPILVEQLSVTEMEELVEEYQLMMLSGPYKRRQTTFSDRLPYDPREGF
jgi:hypothetical protein